MATAVLALQGAFIEHEHRLEELGEEVFELRDLPDLARPFERLVLPGGESTVQAKLLRERGMLEPLRERIADGMPVLGTCAGAILLAQELEGGEPAFGTFPALVRRNAYGRQLGSFVTRAPFGGLGELPMTFIRAPYIAELYEGAEELARVDGRIVAARSGAQLVCAFHPELDDDPSIHQLFLKL